MLAHRSVITIALWCALPLLASVSLVCQTPKDTKVLFLNAAKENSLNGDDIKPWHLKVSYKFLDDSGQTIDNGTIEEIHAEQQKLSKIVISRSGSSLAFIRTEKGVYRDGELDRKFALLMLLASSFTRPMPWVDKLPPFLNLKLQTRAIGGADLSCFSFNGGNGSSSAFNDPAYCLQSTLPILRLGCFPDDSHQFIRNHIVQFQGRYVPVDITSGESDKPELLAHLDLLQQISSIDSADFLPSPNAVLQKSARSTLIVPEDFIDTNSPSPRVRPISRPQPDYPEAARAANVHGIVKLRTTIGSDGHIAGVHVISGPPQLQNAAVDAVWRWTFEPPWHSEGPAQVITVFSVKF